MMLRSCFWARLGWCWQLGSRPQPCYANTHFDHLSFFSFSLWSLQTFKTFLISVMFVVSSDIMHGSYVLMLNGCFLYNDRYSSMFA